MESNTVISANGCVKWFNSKHKYGFITVLSDGEYKNTDLFVHQSNIITKEPCYRFLVAGENVNFDIKHTDNEKNPIQTVNITSMNNVAFKCEIPRPPRSQSNINNRSQNFVGQNRNSFQQNGNGYQSDNYRGNSYRGNSYRGNSYRGNSYRGNNYRGNSNNVNNQSKTDTVIQTSTTETTSS